MSVEIDRERLFDAVQATWKLLEPSAGPALEAHTSGLGVIFKEALANGRLTIRNRDPEFAARLRSSTKAFFARPGSFSDLPATYRAVLMALEDRRLVWMADRTLWANWPRRRATTWSWSRGDAHGLG